MAEGPQEGRVAAQTNPGGRDNFVGAPSPFPFCLQPIAPSPRLPFCESHAGCRIAPSAASGIVGRYSYNKHSRESDLQPRVGLPAGKFGRERRIPAPGGCPPRHERRRPDGLFRTTHRGVSSRSSRRAQEHRPQAIDHPGTAQRRLARKDRRDCGHERQPRVHRREDGRRGGVRVSVFDRADRRDSAHRGDGGRGAGQRAWRGPRWKGSAGCRGGAPRRWVSQEQGTPEPCPTRRFVGFACSPGFDRRAPAAGATTQIPAAARPACDRARSATDPDRHPGGDGRLFRAHVRPVRAEPRTPRTQADAGYRRTIRGRPRGRSGARAFSRAR